MRKVAAAIGAGAASLYRYVETRDELLELMSDTVSGQLDLSAPPTGNWRADILALAHEIRRVYRLHPWMLDVQASPLWAPTQSTTLNTPSRSSRTSPSRLGSRWRSSP